MSQFFPYDWALNMCRAEERPMGQSLFLLKKLPPEVERCIDKGEAITGNKVRMDKMAIEGCPYGP